jgi:creatinine amidohydrolase
MLNSEVEEYLNENDTIIVPVGTVEVHGGMPLDSETVISEAFALKMAEQCNGLVLTGLPYFYAGATATGRGTVQVSVRQGIDYLGAIARSLLRQGFKRQIYVSFHGPALMTCSPMVRDFFDETGVPILYIDLSIQMFKNARDMIKTMESFHAVTVASYDIMGRLEDVPLTTEYCHSEPQTVAQFNDLFAFAHQSGSVGYYFGDPKDHMSTSAIPTAEVRKELAVSGTEIINKVVEAMNMTKVVSDLKNLEDFQRVQFEKYPWTPAAYNRK